MHIPDRVDIVSDGRGPRSGGGSHREDRVGVADARAQPVLVCQVFGSEDLQNLVVFVEKSVSTLSASL